MTYALMSSGGKDCTLAYDRALQKRLDVRYLVSLYEGSTGRIRFHGTRHELVRRHAEALGLEPILRPTGDRDFDAVFRHLLEELKERGCRGLVFGNVHLADVRAWYEERVTAAGLAHVEMLWGEPSIELLHEIVERGYHGMVVSVNLTLAAVRFLGRELDADLVTDIGITDDLDPGGEFGEFHTFISDGPEFSTSIKFEIGETLEIEDHRFLDLVPTD